MTVLLAAALARCAFLLGVWRPVRVVGGSMAEALYGPHWAVTCRDCGCPFRCGVEYPPPQDDVTCPNCGSEVNRVTGRAVESGQRVWIDRWPALTHRLQPWQPVAFHPPGEPGSDEPDSLTVKRLVARGPGRVSLQDGDVYLDGRLQQKELAQLRDVRVLVYDDRFRDAGASRWQASEPTTWWRRTAAGYQRQGPADARLPLDWLEYQQWTCWPRDDPHRPRCQPVDIVDHDAYNQGLSRGSLHPVPDLMLSLRLQLSPDARCTLRLISRADTFDWELAGGDPQWRLLWNGTPAQCGRRPARRGPWYLELAVCDHRVLAALDGMTLVQFSYTPREGAASPFVTRVALGAAGAAAECQLLRIHRDLYYLGPGGAVSWQAPNRLEYGQWFVLGDNVPISVDSRYWSALGEPLIVGVVRPWRR